MSVHRVADSPLGATYAPPESSVGRRSAARTPHLVATLRLPDAMLAVGRAEQSVTLTAEAGGVRVALLATLEEVSAWIERACVLLRLDVPLDAGDEVAYRTPVLRGTGGDLTAGRTFDTAGSHYEVRVVSAEGTASLVLPVTTLAAFVEALRAACEERGPA